MKHLIKKTPYLESFLPPWPWAKTTRHRSVDRVLPLCRTWLEVSNRCNMEAAGGRCSQKKRGAVNYCKNGIDFRAVPYIPMPSRAAR